MSPEHFKFLTALLHRECGLILDEDKTYLEESRLAPVARQFGRKDIDDLIPNVMATAPQQAIAAIVDAMVTNERYFFRDRQPFTHFATETLPALIKARRDVKRLQIWSAAASTGQEAYSLAMILSTYAEQLNLLKDVSPLREFDAIFCRNVLIYFHTDRRRNVLDQISKALRPDGTLYLGGSATITRISLVFTPVDDARGMYHPVPQQSEIQAARST
jgi:chemotaxis methyl-accepting protein methylase